MQIPIPELEGCDENLYLRFPIRKGRVVIREDQLRLRENTPGISNTRYIVELRAHFESSALNDRYQLEPFLINIMFTNDTQRQQQLNEIQTNISICQNQRDDIRKELEEKDKECRDQNRKLRRVKDKERDIIYKLTALRETSDLSDGTKIANKLKENEQKLNQLKAKQSGRTVRGKHIESAPQTEGVIGKIADLAFIVDEGYAKSISWFLRNHMNTIVVQNAQTAERLSDEYGIESTLSLDSITDRLPNFHAHLPHEGPNGFRFYLTIGWVRSLLRFNETSSEVQVLEKVFTSVLGDTLFTTDLQKSKQYRKQFDIKLGICPTIVAKDGILYENGIIELIPKDDNFVWFQSPPDRDYIRVQKIFDFLKELSEVHNEKVEEFNKYEKLDNELKSLKREREQQLSELDQTIHERTTEFAEISQTPLELLDEDSNHSNRSYSTDGYKRRRSYDDRSRSPSRERKRSRH